MSGKRRAAIAFGGLAALAVGGILAADAASDAAPGAGALPPSTLAVRTPAGGWHEWWRSDRAPERWDSAATPLAPRVWREAIDGIRWTDLELSGRGEAWRTRVIAVRLDPRQTDLQLDTAFAPAMHPAWSLEHAPDDARLAVNAGQFVESLPWGLVVLDGHVFLRAGHGPLSAALFIDRDAGVRWVPGDSAGAVARDRPPRWAFQSYPVLLVHGVVPAPLRASGAGLDVAHRDSRLAIGLLANGDLLLVLTRFDAAGQALGGVPFGLTVPEMAAVMGAFGCREAMLLDGGISGQMLLRERDGVVHSWPGIRRVPLALLALPRTATGGGAAGS